MRDVEAPTVADVHVCHVRVRELLAPTPLVESAELGALLKLETFQPTGSFKVRGAVAALTALGAGESVVTASAGNHGLAVAWAAGRLGIDATVVVAETASPAKVEALRRLPAELVVHGAGYDEAERHALELAADGRRYVSAYNDREVIAGQGTLALELLSSLGPELTVVCPTGGGGLAAGVALVAAPAGARVVGVVAAASPAFRVAFEQGRIVDVPVLDTFADGLAGNIELGSVTVALAREHLSGVVEVSEEEIAAAMRFLVREHGLVAEGSGAAAVAALLAGKIERRGTTVALVTGRNVTAATLARALGA
ncbi:MAG TPA: pyridoxal-phosphate dependent enzyme [Gaiellaceae bacterium]